MAEDKHLLRGLRTDFGRNCVLWLAGVSYLSIVQVLRVPYCHVDWVVPILSNVFEFVLWCRLTLIISADSASKVSIVVAIHPEVIAHDPRAVFHIERDVVNELDMGSKFVGFASFARNIYALYLSEPR